MYIAKQSTSITVAFGPFLDETDGKTAETGLTLTQPDIRLSKNGGAFAQRNSAGTLSHMENGYYSLTLDTTDTNTVGTLRVHVHESGALPVWLDIQILEEAVYDALFGASATGLLPANVTQWLGSAAATPSVAGVPEVDLTHVAGSTTSVSTLASSVATLLAAIGAVNDAAADGDPTNTDTAMAYLKQLINVLIGTAGVVAFPSSATPGNAVSLAEVVRQIYDEVAGLNGGALLDAAAVRSAVGLASANLDTQIDALPTAAEIVTAILAGQYEGTETIQTALRLFRAALVGLVTGAGTTTVTFFGKDEVTDRIVATVDDDGNRSAVAVDGS